MVSATIQNISFENGPGGKKVLSLQLYSGSSNVTGTIAASIAPIEELQKLAEPMPYEPDRWTGIGEGCPLRMKMVGEGPEEKMHVMFNHPYCDQAMGFNEHSAMMKLPEILEEKGLLEMSNIEALRAQIVANVPDVPMTGPHRPSAGK